MVQTSHHVECHVGDCSSPRLSAKDSARQLAGHTKLFLGCHIFFNENTFEGQAKLDKDASQRAGVEVREQWTVEKSFKLGDCSRLLDSLEIGMIDGNCKAPIMFPTGFNCETFPMGKYDSEEKAHPEFIFFLTEELKAKGVQMDEDGGFQVADIRRKTLYHMSAGESDLKGAVDAAIVPWETGLINPKSQVRCSLEFKFTKDPEELGPAFFSGTTFGQSCAEAVAAFVFSEYPVLLHVTTSFYDSVLLEIRREKGAFVITYWSGVTFDSVVFKLVEHPKNCDPTLPYFLRPDEQDPDSQEIKQWRKKLRLRRGSLLLDELDALSAIFDNPNERFFHAYELVRSYRKNEEAL